MPRAHILSLESITATARSRPDSAIREKVSRAILLCVFLEVSRNTRRPAGIASRSAPARIAAVFPMPVGASTRTLPELDTASAASFSSLSWPGLLEANGKIPPFDSLSSCLLRLARHISRSPAAVRSMSLQEASISSRESSIGISTGGGSPLTHGRITSLIETPGRSGDPPARALA